VKTANPKISVIIPVYNASSFLDVCLHSVLNQTFRNIEVIAINDGSTDDSSLILDQWAQIDLRLKILQTTNRGVSFARNMGLTVATGEFIAFVDADDWMEPEMLEKFYEAVTSNDCDWAICNATVIGEAPSASIRLKLKNEVITLTNDRSAFIQHLMQFKFDYANWNKMFLSSIIQQQKLRFEENLFLWEDLLFNLQYLHYSNKVAVIEESLYNYRVQPNSLYNSKSENRLPQFNLLFQKFTDWCSVRKCSEEDSFRREMARLTYNQALYEAERRVKEKSTGFFSIWLEYTRELNRFDRRIFYFPESGKKDFQAFKKYLLARHWFSLFALFGASKIFWVKFVSSKSGLR
jgi:glycosyltransferase involved in cell wall biosynthesis